MEQAGGLIQLHYHTNQDSVLDQLLDVQNILYYKSRPLFFNLNISSETNNLLIKKSDGLYADGTFLARFSYHDSELYFDSKIVSREYNNTQITNAVNSIWITNPYQTIGKIDMSYWLTPINITSTAISYKNTSDTAFDVVITNNDMQELVVNNAGTTQTLSAQKIYVTLAANKILLITSSNGERLNVTVTTKG